MENKKLFAFLIGLLPVIGSIVVWIILYVFVDIVSGWTAFIMGWGFYGLYRYFNFEDESNFPLISAVLLTIAGCLIAEFVSIALYLSIEGISFDIIFSSDELFGSFIGGVASDLVFGLVGIVFLVIGRKKIDEEIKQRVEKNRGISNNIVE